MQNSISFHLIYTFRYFQSFTEPQLSFFCTHQILLARHPKTCERVRVKVSVVLGKTAPQIPEELKTVNLASASSQATVFKWVKHFNRGNSSLEDKRGKCKPALVSDDKLTACVQEVVDGDSRVTVVYSAQEWGISTGSVSKILRHKLGYRKVCMMWTPHRRTIG